MYISFQKVPNWVRVRIYISFTVLSILARVMLYDEHIYLDHKIRVNISTVTLYLQV